MTSLRIRPAAQNSSGSSEVFNLKRGGVFSVDANQSGLTNSPSLTTVVVSQSPSQSPSQLALLALQTRPQLALNWPYQLALSVDAYQSGLTN